MTIKSETRGRKPLPPEERKAPQATVKINDFILPFVKELKGNLKKGKVTKKTMARLFNVLNNNWEQSSALEEQETSQCDDVKRLKSEVQRLKTKLSSDTTDSAVKPLEPSERLELVNKYHAEHLKVVHLESKDMTNKSSIKSLMLKIERLEHLEHDCQALKATNNERCTRPAKTTVHWHGVEIHVCLQHSKSLKK